MSESGGEMPTIVIEIVAIVADMTVACLVISLDFTLGKSPEQKKIADFIWINCRYLLVFYLQEILTSPSFLTGTLSGSYQAALLHNEIIDF